jgi:hypothetical protein
MVSSCCGARCANMADFVAGRVDKATKSAIHHNT